MSGTTKKAAIKAKYEAAQALLPTAKWGDEPADNCWTFEYLGSIFTPDGSFMSDVRRRIAMVQQRHGKMRHIWKSQDLHPRLKLRLYVASVLSIMAYGSEAWRLTAEAQKTINGANSKMVAMITGRTIHEEAREGKTYDAVAGIRATRMKWLGCILRLGEKRMIFKAVKTLYHHRQSGDLLMDAPGSEDWEDLVKQAKDEKKWQQAVRAIKDTICIQTAKGGKQKKPKIGKEKVSAKATAAPSRKVSVKKRGKGSERGESDSGSDDEEW